MKTNRVTPKPAMNPEAYAGFLKLWLTPGNVAVLRSPEVDAYIAYLNRHEPLSATVRRALGQTTEQAA